MGSATEWVRRALAELGPDAPAQTIKAFIRERDWTIPEGHISLALRKVREKAISTERRRSRKKQMRTSPSQGKLSLE